MRAIVSALGRVFWASALAVVLLACQPANGQIEIVDQAGRTVRLSEPARRIFFSEPGDFSMLALLVENPASRIVAWNRWRLDEHTLEIWRGIDPAAFDQISQMAVDGPQNLSAESLIVHEPDLVVLDHFFGKATHVVRKLEQADIPVAILNLEPLLTQENPAEGLEKLAVLVGRAERGREVSQFIRTRRDRVAGRVKQLSAQGVEPPTVLMEPHAGIGPCCLSMGLGRSMGDMVAIAGGRLIGSEIIDEMSGRLSPEYVIASNPEVYIGTGGRHLESRNGLVLGVGIDPGRAEASLRAVMKRVGLQQTRAMEQGRVHGVWHGGFGIVNLELIATWLYPEHFHDVDPAGTQAEIEQRFLPIRLQGTFWTSLQAKER
ncbi:ABC transporter substrate-binding protein [Achromobacter sp. F4_2707]|uniref:ABC transporter substrate-binding protein n=1 Tax=Achromobacter sp. F4_2707 TaxID=3114286 RepID=UPI0039C67841